MTSAVSLGYNAQYSDHVIQANAKLRFSMMKNGVGPSYNKASTTSDYNNACNNVWTVKLVGGESTLPISQWTNWIDSIHNLPVQVTMQLANITAFISNPQIRQNVQTYLNSYYQQNINSKSSMESLATKIKKY